MDQRKNHNSEKSVHKCTTTICDKALLNRSLNLREEHSKYFKEDLGLSKW